jgi:hypothetical protein
MNTLLPVSVWYIPTPDAVQCVQTRGIKDLGQSIPFILHNRENANFLIFFKKTENPTEIGPGRKRTAI